MKPCLVIDAFSGAGGDMLLAALIDAGAPLDLLRDRLLSIPALAKVRLEVETVQRGAFASKRLVVDAPHEHVHRGLADIVRIVDSAASLSDRARSRAKDAFARLAAAEAKVHGTSVDAVHFHEVGALDAIVDVVGFFAAADSLDVHTFYYTNLALGGGGTIRGAHGVMPAPAPATLELLRDHRVTYTDRAEELMTPTAAAVIASAFAPLPADARMVQGRVGYGAGARESAGMPNVLRLWLGRIATSSPREVAIIRCTIDNMNPELYGQLMPRAFEHGALEIYYTPVFMKKNRPGVEVTVIAEMRDAERVSTMLLSHTTTLGVRVSREERVELERRVETIETPLGPAKVKVAVLPDGTSRMSPEYEACREIAERTGRTLLEVFDVVRAAWPGRSL